MVASLSTYFESSSGFIGGFIVLILQVIFVISYFLLNIGLELLSMTRERSRETWLDRRGWLNPRISSKIDIIDMLTT